MLSILLGLIFNFNSLIALAVMAGVAALIYTAFGPARLFKIAADVRTWLLVFGVLAAMAFAHEQKRNDELEAKLDTAIEQQRADADAQESLERRAEQRETRRRQDDRIRDAIDRAPTGQRHDAALDAIAAEQALRETPPPPISNGAQDALLDERAALQAPTAAGDPGGDRDASSDGVRKQPDVVVVP